MLHHLWNKKYIIYIYNVYNVYVYNTHIYIMYTYIYNMYTYYIHTHYIHITTLYIYIHTMCAVYMYIIYIHCIHIQGLPGCSAGKESACNAGDLGLIPGLWRSSGEGKGYPLQYSSLENSMDCIVNGATKSWTRLSDFHFHISNHTYK